MCWGKLWNQLQPGIALTFCFFCMVGAAGMAMVAAVGYQGAVDDEQYEGVCSLSSATASCECAAWDRDGYCSAYEAVYGSSRFLPEAEGDEVECGLKLGPGSVASCLHPVLTDATGVLQGTPLDTPVTLDRFPCRLLAASYSCFLPRETANDRNKASYLALLVGAAAWGCVSVLWFCILMGRHAARRSAKFARLETEKHNREQEEGEEGEAARNGSVHMKGDVVAIVVGEDWAEGRVAARHGEDSYDVEVQGTLHKNVPSRKVRSAGFYEGGWVAAAEPIDIEDSPFQFPMGTLGVVSSIRREPEGLRTIEAAIGGAVVVVKPGQVYPTPPVRRGHSVEVRRSLSEGQWEPAVVSGVHGDGVLLVGTPAKAFRWCRRPLGVAVESRQNPPAPEGIPATFVFIDPDSHLAPTIMSTDEVQLYGGVRSVARDLAEFRTAPTGKLLASAALLSASHVAAQHLSGSERMRQQKLQQQQQPAPAPVPSPAPVPTPPTFDAVPQQF